MLYKPKGKLPLPDDEDEDDDEAERLVCAVIRDDGTTLLIMSW